MVEFLLDRKQLNLKAKTSLSTMAEVGELMLTLTAPWYLNPPPRATCGDQTPDMIPATATQHLTVAPTIRKAKRPLQTVAASALSPCPLPMVAAHHQTVPIKVTHAEAKNNSLTRLRLRARTWEAFRPTPCLPQAVAGEKILGAAQQPCNVSP
jgi:hypothetical protein